MTLAMGKSPLRGSIGQMSAEKLLKSRASIGDSNFHGVASYPKIDFKGDEDFAIKILDNMI